MEKNATYSATPSMKIVAHAVMQPGCGRPGKDYSPRREPWELGTQKQPRSPARGDRRKLRPFYNPAFLVRNAVKLIDQLVNIFSRGNGNIRNRLHLSASPDIIGLNGFFQPEQVQGFAGPSKANRFVGIPTVVGIYHNVNSRPQGAPHRLDALLNRRFSKS